MRFPARQRHVVALPGLVGTARVARRTAQVLPRLQPGDVAVIDHVDMDRATAQSLLDAGVSAVVNASPMISGRYPNLGPQLLASADVTLIDSITPAGLAAVRDGQQVRLHDGAVFVGEQEVAAGRALDTDLVAEQMEAARSGMVAHLQTLSHNSSEFLQREEDLLLHGRGLPRLSTPMSGRPVVVVVPGGNTAAELSRLRPFLREQRPVLIGVAAGAEALRRAGHRPDVVVLDARTEAEERPAAELLRRARDVVVRVDRAGDRSVVDQLDRLGLRATAVETSATAADAALLLAGAGHARVIVAVGMPGSLEQFLDRQRTGLASTYLTRLKVAPRLVDARAVPVLYSGRVRPRHLAAVTVAGLVALGSALAVTPVGHEWASSAVDAVSHVLSPQSTSP